MILAGPTALIIPFLFHGPSPSGTTTPPPPVRGGTTPLSGGNGGGSASGGGSQDTSLPQTTISIRAPFDFPRAGNIYYYPNFTSTLHALDDMNLSTVSLNEAGTVHT